MFTVVIAEKKHIKKIKKNLLYKDVFRDDTKFAFCPWNIGENSLELALPTLYECVGKRHQWRAILFTDVLNQTAKNPFDVAQFKADRLGFTKDEKAFDEELSLRKQAYSRTVEENPLAILLQMLCNDDRTDEIGEEQKKMESSLDDSAAEKDTFYKMYLETKNYKQSIIKDYLIKDSSMVKPSEVLCISPRVFDNDSLELMKNWEPLDEINYSDFCEYNLYPNKARFLVFDIVDEKHILHKKHFLKLLVVLFIMATNDIPRSSMNPDKLYRINTEYNDKAFGELFYNYEKKLSQSCLTINRKLVELQSPYEFEDLKNDFESKENIELDVNKYFNPSKMNIHYSGIRLADDIPDDEKELLDEEEHSSRMDTNVYLKQPRRIISEGIDNSLKYDSYDEDEILKLDKFKVDDLDELANDSELQMSKIKKKNVFNTKEYRERLNEKVNSINSYAGKRMSFKKILITVLIVIGSLVLPATPYIIKNIVGSKSPAYNLEVLLWVLVSLLLVSIVPLIVFRIILGFRVKDYNSEIASMREEVEKEVDKVGEYLSNVKTLRKCKRVKEIFSKGGIVKKAKINNLKRHKNDILNHIQSCETLLSDLYTGFIFDEEEVEGYNYDFTVDAKYEYPLPLESLNSMEIDYIYKGNKIQTPINFVDSIIITREDIYD